MHKAGNAQLEVLASIIGYVCNQVMVLISDMTAQELANILQQIPGMQQREGPRRGKHRFKDRSKQDADEEPLGSEEQQGADQQASRMQIFVFSATLTLPQSLRKRLRKGAALPC